MRSKSGFCYTEGSFGEEVCVFVFCSNDICCYGVWSKLFLEPLMVFSKYFHNGLRWSLDTEKEVVLFFVRLSGSLMIEFNPMFLNLLYISPSLSQLISSSKQHLPLQHRESVLVSILFLTFSVLNFFCVGFSIIQNPTQAFVKALEQ